MKNNIPVWWFPVLCLFSTPGHAHSLSLPHPHFESAAVILVAVITLLITVLALIIRCQGRMTMTKAVELNRLMVGSKATVLNRTTTPK